MRVCSITLTAYFLRRALGFIDAHILSDALRSGATGRVGVALPWWRKRVGAALVLATTHMSAGIARCAHGWQPAMAHVHLWVYRVHTGYAACCDASSHASCAVMRRAARQDMSDDFGIKKVAGAATVKRGEMVR